MHYLIVISYYTHAISYTVPVLSCPVLSCPVLSCPCITLCTIAGDLRLVERPSPITLGPQDFANIRASIKVSSTENGIIFGNISERDNEIL